MNKASLQAYILYFFFLIDKVNTSLDNKYIIKNQEVYIVKKQHIFLFLCLLVCVFFLISCSKPKVQENNQEKEPRDYTPTVLTPEASGTSLWQTENVVVDISNASSGYFMVKYTGTVPKVRVQTVTPDGTKNQPLLTVDGNYHTFPFSGGNGTYQINILENTTGDKYAILLSETIEVTLENEFSPFLYPNQYVDFTEGNQTVEKGAELANGTYSDLEVIQNIYTYVTKNITYDEQKATEVVDGYLPVVDETLASGTGICFDYAALMASMMRTQRIPTKLEIGYSGEVKHAWISAYVDEIGWVDDIIQFDGSSWTLMDPTLASNNSRKSVGKYIGDGKNYTLQYSY